MTSGSFTGKIPVGRYLGCHANLLKQFLVLFFSRESELQSPSKISSCLKLIESMTKHLFLYGSDADTT